MNKTRSLRNIVSIYAFIFVVWGFYRLLVRLPETLEEMVLKPLIWLGPLYWILYKERQGISSLGWTTKNLFKSIYLAIGLGILFAVEGMLVNSIKHGGSFNFLESLPQLENSTLVGALWISLATAVSEETVFRGFIFNRLSKIIGEWSASILTSAGWAVVHLPIVVFVFKYDATQVISFLFLSFLFGIASCFVFSKTKNIISSVLLHVFWEWPIILFR